MQTSVQPISDVEVKVEVTIASEAVDREYAKQLQKVRKRARVKGFRPGKAPKGLVQRLYAEQLASDTATQLITETWSEALETVSRDKLGEPSFEPSLARAGEPLHYAMRIEVKPEIALTAWQGIEVAVPPAAITDEAVDAELQRLREGHKEQVAVEGRGADIGDVLLIDTHGTIDGEEDDRLHTHAMRIRLGDEDLLPGLGDQLMGVTAEETRSIRLTFPDDFRPEALAGKEAAMEVQVEQHFVEEIPDLDDDLAQDLGHDTLAELTEAVTARLRAQAEEVRGQQAEDKILRVLLERHGFEVPRAMLAAQFQHQARMTAMRLQIQGAPQEMVGQLLEANRDAILGQAGLSVRRYLALEALARQEGLAITDEALDAEIAQRVAAAPPTRAPNFEEPEAREGLRGELLEQAALALLREHAVITDAAPEPEPEPEPTLDTSADVDDDAPAADPAETPATGEEP